MIIICIIAETLTQRNQKELEKCDTPENVIHVFDQMIDSGVTFGKILTILDEVRESGQEAAFYSDISSLCKYVSCFCGDLFSYVFAAGEQSKHECDAQEYEALCDHEDECAELAWAIKELHRLKWMFRESAGRKQQMSEEENIRFCNTVRETFKKIPCRMQNISPEAYGAYWKFVEEYAEILNDTDMAFRIFLLSALLGVKREAGYAEAICREAVDAGMDIGELFYLYQQLIRFYFENTDIPYTSYIDRLYDVIFECWKQALLPLLTPIPKSERNRKNTVVIARQMLSLLHAPTKTAMERIYTLGKYFDKQVLCIHSKEFLTQKGSVPLYFAGYGNVDESLSGMHDVKYRDYEFRMYQPEGRMPDPAEIQKILVSIRAQKPYEIIVIGDHCLLGDLCAEMIPTICIPIVFSLPIKKNQMIAVGKTLTESDYRSIEQAGGKREQYIESMFTYQPITQKLKLTREEIGLPENKFLLAVIGTRLDIEVTGEFVKALERLPQYGIHIVFAGVFDHYGDFCEQYAFLKESSTLVEYQKDLPAFEELCDLYVNPKRSGGGISAVEAFYKHKPGVTLPYGDVAVIMGEEFQVRDYDEMEEKILQYKEQPDYYDKMAEKAYQRSLELFDGKAAMEHILREAEKREGFF